MVPAKTISAFFKISGFISSPPNETRIGNTKGDDSIVPIDIWDRRAWTYKGVGVSEDLNIIWERMMRWRRRKLMR